MPKTDKLYKRLAQIEADLKALLLNALDETIRTGHVWVFDNPETTPFLNAWWFKRERLHEVLDLVAEIESLRDKLKEPLDEGIAALYRRYSREFHNRANEQRLGPKREVAGFVWTVGSSS